MTDALPTIGATAPDELLTDPDTFAEYSDRELAEFTAARLNDIARAVQTVAEAAPDAFAKFANPMVQLAFKALIK